MLGSKNMLPAERRHRLLKSLIACGRAREEEDTIVYCNIAHLIECVGIDVAEQLIAEPLVEMRGLVSRKYKRRPDLVQEGIVGIYREVAMAAVKHAMDTHKDPQMPTNPNLPQKFQSELPTDPWNTARTTKREGRGLPPGVKSRTHENVSRVKAHNDPPPQPKSGDTDAGKKS